MGVKHMLSFMLYNINTCYCSRISGSHFVHKHAKSRYINLLLVPSRLQLTLKSPHSTSHRLLCVWCYLLTVFNLGFIFLPRLQNRFSLSFTFTEKKHSSSNDLELRPIILTCKFDQDRVKTNHQNKYLHQRS